MSSNLGRYKAEITADTHKFRKELGGAENASKKFKNSASAMSSAVAAIDGPFGGISSRISAFTSLASSGGLAVGVLAGSIAALGAVTHATVKHMGKLEVATAKTEAILKATGNASGYTSQQLDVMARSVALSTLASTEGIRNAQNSLLTFKSVSGPVFERTIKLAQDMSAVIGGDAKSSALQLGKALEDPITGLTSLRRAGVSFTYQQKEQIKTMVEVGNKAEAQRLILAELEKQIGGAGNAEAKGLTGAIDTLGHRWSDLLELWDKTTGTTSKVTEVINQIASGMRNLTADMEYTTSAAGLFEARLNKTLELERLLQNGGPKNGHRKRVYDERVKSLKAEILLLGDKLGKQVEINTAEAKKGVSAYDAKIKAQLEASKENEVAYNKKRLKALTTSLSKEVSAISASLLTKEAKEDEYYLKRIDSLEKLAELEPGRKKEVNKLLLAEHDRHLDAVEAAEAESLKKRQEKRLKEFSGLSVVSSPLNNAVARDVAILKTPEEKEIKEHKARIDRLEMFGENNKNLQVFTNKQIEREQTRHADAMDAIESNSNKDRLSGMSSMFGNLSSLMNSKSKKLFKIGKAAAVARAMISGYESVTHSYKWGTSIGGPALGAVFAATAAAATAVQIQNIASQKFGGGGTVTAGTSGGAGPGVYQPPQPTVPSGELSGSDGSRSVQIIFTGDVNGINAEHLAETLKDHLDNTDFVLVEPGSRNGQILAA